MQRLVLAGFVIGAAMAAGGAAARGRTFTDATGRYHFEAEFVDLSDGKVLLRSDDGRMVAVPREQFDREFSRADREYVDAELVRRRKALLAELSDKPGLVAYGPARRLCNLASAAVDESSGLACSRVRPGVFWTHNDSGDDARIYAFDRDGRDLGACRLEGVVAFDWEDIASFTHRGKSYLLLGDIGNNGLAAEVQILYLVEEPPVDPRKGVTVPSVPVVQTINFSYEDDHRNCEGLAVDPTTRTILLVSKELNADCYVYALPWPKNEPDRAVVARKIARLKIPAATGMDVSPDGRRAVVLTYHHAYEYGRAAGEDWAAAFARRPAEILLPERVQGESICYGRDGKTLYLTSEKLPTPLWEVPVRKD